MSDDQPVNRREFELFGKLLMERLDDLKENIQMTQDLQRTTNGRLLKAEQTIAVLSSARLIDRTDGLARAVQEVQSDLRRDADDARRLSDDAREVGRERSALKVAGVASAFGLGSGLLGHWLAKVLKWL